MKEIINLKFKTRLGLAMASFVALGASAQVVKHERLLSFEDGVVPSFITTDKGALGINDEHYKDGLHCMQWTYKPGAVLSFKKDLKFEKLDPSGKDLYLSAFIVWVYNEKAQDKKIRFEFLKDGKVCTSFPFGINFTGWRAAWVCYERDMEGTPEEGMNEIRVQAPDVEGTLYFDHVITASKVDPRQQTADIQVPFVNKGTKSHWLQIYPHSLWKPDIELRTLTEKDKQDINLMEKRFRDMLYTPSQLTDKEVKAIKKAFSQYNIVYKNGKVSGMPIFMVRQAEAYERMIDGWDKDMFTKLGMEMNKYFNLMKRVAVAYNNAVKDDDKKELEYIFNAMYDHITDQGVAYGSCWGNIHHYGYSMRGLYPAYFLMKDVLRKRGKLQEAENTLRWYSIANEVYPKPIGNGIDIDTFNTQTQGRIASILIMEDTPEKLQYLRSFSRWIDYGCRPAPGLMGSFKADGASFHHCNNYPAYAVGGLDGATNMIYLFSGTGMRLSEEAHNTVKNVLLAMRFYCNTRQWALSMSGRHPNGKGQLIPIQYAMMAISGTPDGKKNIDPDMAAAYLRLMSLSGSLDRDVPDYLPRTSNALELKLKKQLEDSGYKPEPDPQGNLALGYGCVSVQRRDNWAAVVRGHSRYLWAAEHYLDANFYGRYLAHGSMQILTGKPGQLVTFATSGWQKNGFDWNRFPGSTSIHLPFDKLRAVVLNVDTYSGMEEMLYSDEAFAGGLSQAGMNGNFGMKLHEHDKYNGSHRARKSYHFFDGTIVCLGSDIENDNKDYETETTVFQLAAVTPEMKDYWTNYTPDGRTFIDPNGVGYYLSKETAAESKFEKKFPQTTVGERSAKPTTGDWVSLVVAHGKAPKAKGYEYAVLPRTDVEALNKFAKKPSYKVLQRDRNAHIVRTADGKLTSYVLFETPKTELPKGLVLKADTSCLVMVQDNKDKVLLTVAQPDLALYRGDSDEAFDENGKRKERSIYSRPWKFDESLEIPVTVTLKGKWNVKETPFCKIVSSDKKQTVLKFTCKDAASYDVELIK